MHTVPDTLTNERAAIFVDYHNTRHALQRVGRRVDLVGLRDYLAEGRHTIETFIYIATHPQPARQAEDRDLFRRLQQHGFLIRTKTGQQLPNGHLKCDFDLEMALDVQEFVNRTRLDIVVLVTGDGDFTPLAQRLRLRGIRVEVASIPGSTARALQTMANGFVDLTQIGAAVDPLPLPEAAPGAEELQPQAEALLPEAAQPEPALDEEAPEWLDE